MWIGGLARAQQWKRKVKYQKIVFLLCCIINIKVVQGWLKTASDLLLLSKLRRFRIARIALNPINLRSILRWIQPLIIFFAMVTPSAKGKQEGPPIGVAVRNAAPLILKQRLYRKQETSIAHFQNCQHFQNRLNGYWELATRTYLKCNVINILLPAQKSAERIGGAENDH